MRAGQAAVWLAPVCFCGWLAFVTIADGFEITAVDVVQVQDEGDPLIASAQGWLTGYSMSGRLSAVADGQYYPAASSSGGATDA